MRLGLCIAGSHGPVFGYGGSRCVTGLSTHEHDHCNDAVRGDSLNKRFIKQVLNQAPEFGVVDHYFYELPVGHILTGFLCERGSGACYVWKYAFPLYDRFHHLHLLYGNRLPLGEGIIDAHVSETQRIASEFMKRIEPYRDEVRSLAQYNRFAEFLIERRSFKRDDVRRTYALTLIMLGREKKAKSELARLAQAEDVIDDVPFLLDQLSQGVHVAQATLAEWEQDTKRQLEI